MHFLLLLVLALVLVLVPFLPGVVRNQFLGPMGRIETVFFCALLHSSPVQYPLPTLCYSSQYLRILFLILSYTFLSQFTLQNLGQFLMKAPGDGHGPVHVAVRRIELCHLFYHILLTDSPNILSTPKSN